MRPPFPTRPVADHSWPDVLVAEVSEAEEVRRARAEHERALARERVFLGSGGWGD